MRWRTSKRRPLPGHQPHVPGLHKRAASARGSAPSPSCLSCAHLDGALQLALKLGAGGARKGLLEDGHNERVGGEERARARHIAADHAARRHSTACGREGAVQALAVQRARGGRPGDGQRGARAKLAAVLRPRPSMSPWTRRPPW